MLLWIFCQETYSQYNCQKKTTNQDRQNAQKTISTIKNILYRKIDVWEETDKAKTMVMYELIKYRVNNNSYKYLNK